MTWVPTPIRRARKCIPCPFYNCPERNEYTWPCIESLSSYQESHAASLPFLQPVPLPRPGGACWPAAPPLLSNVAPQNVQTAFATLHSNSGALVHSSLAQTQQEPLLVLVLGLLLALQKKIHLWTMAPAVPLLGPSSQGLRARTTWPEYQTAPTDDVE